jgi:hypothetical protein
MQILTFRLPPGRTEFQYTHRGAHHKYENKSRPTHQDEGGPVGPGRDGREDGRKEERDEEEERHKQRSQAGPAPLPDTRGRLHESSYGGSAQTRAHNDGGCVGHEGGVLAREVALLVNCRGGEARGA